MKRRLSQSAQARWSRKMKKMGRCARCGDKRTDYKQLCNPCQEKQTAYMAQRRTKTKGDQHVNA